MKELILTDENWKIIQNVNSEWNNKIKYGSDIDVWGVAERWSMPKDINGQLTDDCDAYAVAKQRELKDSFGIESWLTLCKTETGGYHLVCMVHTDRGAYVLDNRYPMVYYYKDCNYTWIKIEIEDGTWQNFS